jgi:hypothetical protein
MLMQIHTEDAMIVIGHGITRLQDQPHVSLQPVDTMFAVQDGAVGGSR